MERNKKDLNHLHILCLREELHATNKYSTFYRVALLLDYRIKVSCELNQCRWNVSFFHKCQVSLFLYFTILNDYAGFNKYLTHLIIESIILSIIQSARLIFKLKQFKIFKISESGYYGNKKKGNKISTWILPSAFHSVSPWRTTTISV